VWVDELGWPWPKHACFDHPNESTYSFSTWSPKASGLTNPKPGVITRIRSELHPAEPVVEIRLDNSTRLSLILRWRPSDLTLLGALVIVSLEDHLLLHASYGEISFHSTVELPAVSKNGWVQCARCKAWVMEKYFDGHDDHCRRHYGKSKSRRINPGQHRPKVAVPQNSPPPPPTRPPQTRRVRLAERISSAIDEVARQAWDAASAIANPEARLKLAKHEAIRLIRLLSPHIRRQVEHHFTSQKWAPLLARGPKN
jgi:hypothetical protein